MRRRDLLIGLTAFAATATGGSPPASRRAGAADPALPAPAPAPASGSARPPFWGINTNIKYRRDDPEYRATMIALARELNMEYVREAVFGSGGTDVDVPFDWRWLDRTMDDLEAAGLGCVLALRIEDCRNPDSYGLLWERNVRHRVGTAAKRYGRRILWYTPWNEPDHEAVDLEIVLRAQSIVFDELKSVDEGLLLASAPLTTPRGAHDAMYRLCEGGITRHCDYLACHLHHGVHDGSRNSLKHAWLAQQRANASRGHPLRPVVLSENGYRWTVVRHPEQQLLRAHWARLNQVQVKRYGYDKGIVYSLALSRSQQGTFNLVDPDAGYARYQPTFDAYREAYNPETWSIGRGFNGGFEESQTDPTLGWVVHYDPLSLSGSREIFAEWERVSFRTDGVGARTGQGYCRMTAGDENKVRRLVEGLTRGRPYELAAWVRLSGTGAGAQLAAMGHNRLNGLDDRISSTGEGERWVELRTRFTPSHTWVVIGLDHNGRGEAFWDDVTLQPA